MRHIYQGTSQDGTGRVIQSANIVVYLDDGTTLATIYSVSSGGSAVANSLVQSDAYGWFEFYVDDSEYTPNQKFQMVLSKTGYTGQTWENTKIIPDEPYFYYCDATATNQGVATSRGDRSLKDLVDSIGTDEKTTIRVCNSGTGNTTTYVLGTDLTVPSNIYLDPEPGALIQPAAGVTLTVYRPESFVCPPRQQVIDTTNNSTDPLVFTKNGMIYPETWGANPFDTTDDAVFLTACFAQANGNTVSIGIGTYYSSTAQTITADATRFIGMGAEFTRILFTADTSGFDINTSATTDTFEFSGMSILTDVAGSGSNYAIDYAAQDFSGPYGRAFIMTDCVVRGNNVNADYWNRCVKMTNGWYSDFTRCTFVGEADNYQSAAFGIFADGQSVNVKIDKCEFLYLNISIYVSGESEGWYVSNTTIVGADFGIQWTTTAGEPLLAVNNCHINAWTRGISATNLLDPLFSNNNIYVDRSKGAAIAIAIELGCARGSISSNSISILGTGNTGYAIYSKADYTTYGNNFANGVSEAGTAGISFEATADYNTAVGNIMANFTNAVVDGAATNVVAHNVPAGGTHTT